MTDAAPKTAAGFDALANAEFEKFLNTDGKDCRKMSEPALSVIRHTFVIGFAYGAKWALEDRLKEITP